MRGIYIHAVSSARSSCVGVRPTCGGGVCGCGWEAGITGYDWTVFKPEGNVTGHTETNDAAWTEARAALAAS